MLRAILMLLAGGALAQALPLLLGPWLTRLYRPEDFGRYHLFAAVAANLAVVACARYEFALPLAQGDAEALALRTLCRRVLAAVVALSALGAAAWAWVSSTVWPLWLPVAVGALGAVSLATLNASREQRFRGLATARVLQHGGGAALQALAGLLQAGVTGLIVAPIAAALVALGALGGIGPAGASSAQWRAVARVHRSFPLLNTPHAFLGALQDTLAVGLIAASLGPAAAGAWGLALRYLKAPATLVGGAVSQALYSRLAQAGAGAGNALGAAGCTLAGRALVLRTMGLLALLAAPLVAGLWWLGPALFAWAFGPEWAAAGELARALAVYIGLHFIASPLGVVTMAWRAQAWALQLALVGHCIFVAALAAGLAWGGLVGAGWAASGAMALYFGWYFTRLATWPLLPAGPAEVRPAAPAPATGGLR